MRDSEALMTCFSVPALLLHTQYFLFFLVLSEKQSELTAFPNPLLTATQQLSPRIVAETQAVIGGNPLRAEKTQRVVDVVTVLTVNQSVLEGVGISGILFPSQKSMPTSFFHDALQPHLFYFFHETHLIGGRKAKPQ